MALYQHHHYTARAKKRVIQLYIIVQPSHKPKEALSLMNRTPYQCPCQCGLNKRKLEEKHTSYNNDLAPIKGSAIIFALGH